MNAGRGNGRAVRSAVDLIRDFRKNGQSENHLFKLPYPRLPPARSIPAKAGDDAREAAACPYEFYGKWISDPEAHASRSVVHALHRRTAECPIDGISNGPQPPLSYHRRPATRARIPCCPGRYAVSAPAPVSDPLAAYRITEAPYYRPYGGEVALYQRLRAPPAAHPQGADRLRQDTLRRYMAWKLRPPAGDTGCSGT